MQGYILHCQKVRDEDFIVKILTSNEILTLYRFYGARHSVLQLGYKIDFEIQRDIREIGRLRSPIHLGLIWERDVFKRNFWQIYITLLHKHLVDIQTLSPFYLSHLDIGATRLEKENPIRTLLTIYAKLLNFEGRKSNLSHCLLCNEPLGDNIVVIRSINGVHLKCYNHTKSIYPTSLFSRQEIQKWLEEETTEHLQDTTIKDLWNILQLGI